MIGWLLISIFMSFGIGFVLGLFSAHAPTADPKVQQSLNRAREQLVELEEAATKDWDHLETANREIVEQGEALTRWHDNYMKLQSRFSEFEKSHEREILALNELLQESRAVALVRGAALTDCLAITDDICGKIRLAMGKQESVSDFSRQHENVVIGAGSVANA